MAAIAAAAGILINWDDFYVNHFHAAGGMAYLISQLIDAGLVHKDVTTVAGGEGLVEYTREPVKNAHVEADTILFREGPRESLDTEILTSIDKPFRPDGGLRLLEGNIGRSVMKVSAVNENWLVEAPAIVIDDQNVLIEMHKAGELERDFVVVLRFQGPREGFKIAMVTDGRMSGASGKVPAAIHMHPEALAGGDIGKIETGDIVRVDPETGTVNVVSDPNCWGLCPWPSRVDGIMGPATLVGDVGGTNCRLALAQRNSLGTIELYHSERYAVKDFKHFNDVVTEYLSHHTVNPRRAAFLVR